MAGNLKAKTSVMKEYFGLLPGQTLQAFANELKQLSDDEKLELARGCAKNLGLKQNDCDFLLE